MTIGRLHIGNCSFQIGASGSGGSNDPQPSPYFTYDSNRVITGFVQGSPNVLQEGTYLVWSEEQQSDVEVSYSEYVPPQPFALNDEYALGIADNVFECNNYSGYSLNGPPINHTVASINLPNATSIGVGAFSSNNGFSIVNLPNVTSIWDSAFYQCNNLASISLPNVTSIRESAFYGCTSLTSVTIGSSIETIAAFVFQTYGDPMTLTIDKPMSWVETSYSEWGLPSGSIIVCSGSDTINV